MTASGDFLTALLVTGALNRPVGRILRNAPRCLAGLPVTALRTTRWGLELDVRDSFETLAAMPDEVADELGLERQRHLGHLPWLGYEGPVSATVARVQPPSTSSDRRAAPTRPSPRLRLVAST